MLPSSPPKPRRPEQGVEASSTARTSFHPHKERENTLGDLTRRALKGDRPALRELLATIAPQLRRIVGEVLGSAGDAEDCVQDTLVAFTHALPTFRWDCTVLHFAIRIAIRSALNARRRSFSSRQRSDRVVQLETPLLATETTSGEMPLEFRRTDALRDLLGRLPPGQAHTFALHAVWGYSPKEISEATGVPVNTVRSRIRLARESMRRHIEDNSTLSELFGYRQETTVSRGGRAKGACRSSVTKS
jgi:RNA polymerase sigma-70 factor (ECF subfamily)